MKDDSKNMGDPAGSPEGARQEQGKVYEAALKEYAAKARSFEASKAKLEADHRERYGSLQAEHAQKRENLEKGNRQEMTYLVSIKSRV